MKLQLLVTALFMTLILAGLTGHAGQSKCLAPTGSQARLTCEALEQEYLTMTAQKVGPSKRVLENSLFDVYKVSQSATPDMSELNNRYNTYLNAKKDLKNSQPSAYQTLYEHQTPLFYYQAEHDRSQKATEARQAVVSKALDNYKTTEKAKADEKAKIQAEAIATTDRMNKVADAKSSDRQTMDDMSEIPRCFASGFPVGTSAKNKAKCDRVTDTRSAAKALKLDKIEGLEKMKSCDSGSMLCNPLLSGATPTADGGVQPICVKATINASAECDKRSGSKQKEFIAKLMKDKNNLAALHRLHKTLDNSCGVPQNAGTTNVSMKDVLKAGRELSANAKQRLDDKDFVATCQRLLSSTTDLIGKYPLDPAAAPVSKLQQISEASKTGLGSR